MTKFGRGEIKRYKKRSRCFVVNLDWKMRSGKPVKAYLQPNDIEILEVRRLLPRHRTKYEALVEVAHAWNICILVRVAHAGPGRAAPKVYVILPLRSPNPSTNA